MDLPTNYLTEKQLKQKAQPTHWQQQAEEVAKLFKEPIGRYLRKFKANPDMAGFWLQKAKEIAANPKINDPKKYFWRILNPNKQ